MRILVIFISIYLFSFEGHTQEEKTSTVSILINPGFGFYNSPNYYEGEITDNLIGFHESYFYFQPLAFSMYYKNFGFGFSAWPNLTEDDGKAEEEFKKHVESIYGEKYYLEYDEYNGLSTPGMLFLRLSAHYKFQLKRLLIIPKIGFGYCTVGSNSIDIILKEKDQNNYYLLSYDTDYESTYNLIDLGVLVGYKVMDKSYVSLELGYSNMRGDLDYVERLENLDNSEESRRIIDYPSNTNLFSIGLSLGILLGSE